MRAGFRLYLQAIALILLLCLQAGTAWAQASINADSLFSEARSAAQNSQYSQSRKLARQVLRASPSYTDAAILIGNTYAWEHQYDSARAVLQPLVITAPQNPEVYLALAKVAYWSEAGYDTMLAYANQGLAIDSQSEELKECKIRALLGLEQYKEAERTLETLPKATKLYQDLKTALADAATINSIRIDYQYTSFKQDLADWHFASLEYNRQLSIGGLSARVNYANRFEHGAMQAEVDFWPRLNTNTYLYLNAGVSDSQLFPAYRAGAEVYRKLPFQLEASVGARTLVYPDQTVWLYTGHIGKYFEKYWLSFRPFVQTQAGEVQATGIVQLRRYFKTSNEYLTLILSKGNTPATQIALQEINRLSSERVGLESKFRLSSSLYGGTLLQYERETYSENVSRNRFTTGLSLQYKFR